MAEKRANKYVEVIEKWRIVKWQDSIEDEEKELKEERRMLEEERLKAMYSVVVR